jgi:hypothetical protein
VPSELSTLVFIDSAKPLLPQVRVYQKLGFIPKDIDVKPIEIALENALPDVLNSEISEVNFKNVVNKLGDIMYKFPFSLPPFYIAIIRCLGVLEGLAIQVGWLKSISSRYTNIIFQRISLFLQVDPTSQILSEAYPYVASRVLTDPQDDLQEALRRLALTSEGKIRWDRLEVRSWYKWGFIDHHLILNWVFSLSCRDYWTKPRDLLVMTFLLLLMY